MNKRKEIQERRRQRKQQQRIVTTMMIAGGALILVAVFMLPTIRSAFFPLDDFEKPELTSVPMADGAAMGDPSAPVTMIIYSDFGCSHCANFAEGSEKQIISDYVASGDLYVVYRSVGTLLGNPNTYNAALAAYCAADQGKFWEYHDLLFANQYTLFANTTRNPGNYFTAFADYLGMDVDSFESCLKSDKYQDRAMADEADARSVGVNSTPSFVVNGQLIVGNVPYENFQSTIDAAIAASN